MNMENPVTFTKVSLPYGWLGNMSPHGIVCHERFWKTAEAQPCP